MSVGHLARLIEVEGIPTTIIAIRAFQRQLAALALPRVLITQHLLGRPIGPPHDRMTQRQVVTAALDLLQRAETGGVIEERSGAYTPFTQTEGE